MIIIRLTLYIFFPSNERLNKTPFKCYNLVFSAKIAWNSASKIVINTNFNTPLKKRERDFFVETMIDLSKSLSKLARVAHFLSHSPKTIRLSKHPDRE